MIILGRALQRLVATLPIEIYAQEMGFETKALAHAPIDDKEARIAEHHPTTEAKHDSASGLFDHSSKFYQAQ